MPPVRFEPGAGLAVVGVMLGMKTEVDQRVDVVAGDQIHRSARAAVAAVGPAARDELLAAEAHGAPAAVAGRDFDVDFVNEHGWERVLSG